MRAIGKTENVMAQGQNIEASGYTEGSGLRVSKADMEFVKRSYLMPSMKEPGPMVCKMVMAQKPTLIVVSRDLGEG